MGRVALLRQLAQQAVPGIQREAKPEVVDGLVRHAPLVEIGQGLLAGFGTTQVSPEPGRRHVIELFQPLTVVGVFRRSRSLDDRHVDAGLAAQLAHRLGERRAFDLHHEGEDAATHAAPEAVKNLAGGADREGRSFLGVERTQAFQVLPGPGQGHVGGHHLDDVGSFLDVIDDVLRNEALAHRRFRSRLMVLPRTEPSTLNGKGLKSRTKLTGNSNRPNESVSTAMEGGDRGSRLRPIERGGGWAKRRAPGARGLSRKEKRE